MNESEPLIAPQQTNRRRWWLVGGIVAGTLSLGVLALGIGWGVFHFFTAVPADTYNALYKPGYQTINAGQMRFESESDFVRAEKNLKQLLAKPSMKNSPVPHFLLASLYENQSRSPEAIAHYKSALAIGSRDWYNQTVYQYLNDDARASLAILYYEDNKYNESLQELQQVREPEENTRAELLLSLRDMLEAPDRADFHLALGKALRQDLKLGKARHELGLALKLSTDPTLKQQTGHFIKTQMPRESRDLPPLVRYYNLAGVSHEMDSENLLQAANYYKQAIKEMPEFEFSYNELAMVYHQMKKYDSAAEYAYKATRINPDYYNPYLTLGDIELDREDYRRAISYYDKAREIISRLPDEESLALIANIENQIGFAYEQMRDSSNALAHYREAIRQSSRDEQVGDYEYAEDAINRIAELSEKRKSPGKDQLSYKMK